MAARAAARRRLPPVRPRPALRRAGGRQSALRAALQRARGAAVERSLCAAHRQRRAPADDAYRPPATGQGYEPPRGPIEAYPPPRPGYAQGYPPPPGQAYGQPYPPPQGYGQPYSLTSASPTASPTRRRPTSLQRPALSPGRGYDPGPAALRRAGRDGSYSTREILDAGHGFFGSVSKGLASVVEYAFQKQGRPNGYILGQDAGGAFVAGLRYGEGMLYTKDAGTHRVYWQGPSIGYDAGAEGSKVMVLVYNLRDPEEIYQRFGGVDGSAYLVGGVGVTFQKSGDVDRGADPVRRRPAPRRQHRLSQVHAPADLEPVLSTMLASCACNSGDDT